MEEISSTLGISYQKNSFIGSLGLSPQQLHDLFKVPHTFFYLRSRSEAIFRPDTAMTSTDDAQDNARATDERPSVGSVYDLELISLSQVDKNDYFTLSKEGVTQFRNKVSQFTCLHQWEREFRLFHKIVNINFFKVYKRWKVCTTQTASLRCFLSI